MDRRFAAVPLAACLLPVVLSSAALAQFDTPFDMPLDPSVVKFRLVIVAIAGGAGFLIGLFFSPLFRSVRLTLLIISAVAVAGYATFGQGLLAEALNLVAAYYVFFVALLAGLSFGVSAMAMRRRREEKPTSFGTAEWADVQHLLDHKLFSYDGFLLGSFQVKDKLFPLSYQGQRHLLTVAPTRSGKGVSSIIPNLLLFPGSALVIDPKGENALISAHRRGLGSDERRIEGLGQKVFIVDPWEIAAPQVGLPSAKINPLDWINPEDPDHAENAFLLADALVPTDAQGEERFWDEEAKALLMGVILYVATAPEEAAARNLGRVRDIITMGGAPFEAILEKMFAHPHPVVSSTAVRTAGKEPKLRANVLASVQSHTHFLDSPRIRESLSRSDFKFEDLKTERMTVYLVLPADRLKTFGRWLRLLIQQAITVNARNIDLKPERPVLFMLDEMPTLGRLTMVEQAFGLMAGFGMQLWGIVQDLSQLNRVYGEGWETFISNSGVLQYFGSRDRMTAEYFSTLCGVSTVRVVNWSYAFSETVGQFFSSSSPIGGGASGSSSSGSNTSEGNTRSISANESQRKLAYADELMVLRKDQQIVLVENLNPIRTAKLEWFSNTMLAPLGVNLHPEAANLPRAKPGAKMSIAPLSRSDWLSSERVEEWGRIARQWFLQAKSYVVRNPVTAAVIGFLVLMVLLLL